MVKHILIKDIRGGNDLKEKIKLIYARNILIKSQQTNLTKYCECQIYVSVEICRFNFSLIIFKFPYFQSELLIHIIT